MSDALHDLRRIVGSQARGSAAIRAVHLELTFQDESSCNREKVNLAQRSPGQVPFCPFPLDHTNVLAEQAHVGLATGSGFVTFRIASWLTDRTKSTRTNVAFRTRKDALDCRQDDRARHA